MLYIYSNVDDLQGTEKVGSKHCVALLQHYAHLPNTGAWREGDSVIGNRQIVKGTAIATFVDGRYQSLSTGNHAAFYLSQDANGIWVMDQWKSDTQKPLASKRYIRRKGKNKQGAYVDPSDNADAYSVIQ